MTRLAIALVAVALMAAIAFFPQHWLPFIAIAAAAVIVLAMAGLARRFFDA